MRIYISVYLYENLSLCMRGLDENLSLCMRGLDENISLCMRGLDEHIYLCVSLWEYISVYERVG